MPYKDPTQHTEARRARWKKYYYAHPERSRQRRIDAQKKNSEFVDSFKTECIKCGNHDKRVLDFHHLRDKLLDVARMRVAGWSHKRIKEEIEKCEVLCANCHRILHWEEEQHGQNELLP